MLIAETCKDIKLPDLALAQRVQGRLDSLTKPLGSLGRLEELTCQLAAIQGKETPSVDRKLVVVMAGDHGVTAAGVSAYPAEVTAQMVLNFVAGGAAINVLARHAGARVIVVDMGVAGQPGGGGYLVRKIAHGTRNFAEGTAMDAGQAIAAVEAGIAIAAAEAEAIDLIAGGDMGIGNTTASSAIVVLVTGSAVSAVVGRGTGVDDEALERKRRVVERAVQLHAGWNVGEGRGLRLLECVGGFEIAGLAGLMLGSAARAIPIVLDGFIATAAALVAAEICPAVRHYFIAAHRSEEPGHAIALRYLGLRPLLEWNLRLGEGTGAALAFPLIDASCKILAEMATFANAGVSGRQ